jgi:hypothetical protein
MKMMAGQGTGRITTAIIILADSLEAEVSLKSVFNLHLAYLENLKAIASADWLYESLKAGLASILHNDDEIKGVVSWKRLAKEESKFDTDSFEKDHPDIYAKYPSSEKVTVASIINPSRPYKQEVLTMSLNDQYKNIKFKQAVRELVREYYVAEDDESEHSKRLNYKIDGFFEAGLLVDAATKEDIQLIVDEEHMAAFGMTRLQRRAEKKTNKDFDSIDWSIYDEPSIVRKKQR